MSLNTNIDLETKKYHYELGVLTRCDGSALLNQGGTTIIAAIYGPLEAKPQRLFIDKSSVEVYYRPKIGMPGVMDRFRESIIRNTCETALMAALYPRTSISVIIQEIQDLGELIACAINAACLALLDSGIEMKFLVGAITCMLDAENNLVVNPPRLILQKARATVTFVFDSIHLNVVASHSTGMFTKEQFQQALLECRSAIKPLFESYRNISLNKTL